MLYNYTINIVLESNSSETVDEKVPLVSSDKEQMIKATTEALHDNSKTMETLSIVQTRTSNLTESNMNTTTSIISATTFINPTIGEDLSDDSIKTSHAEDSNMLTNKEYEKVTDIVENKTELTTIESTTSTSNVPADCPVLTDCPIDHCTFARKFDNHGCPTCNCLLTSKSSIICPKLTCQECLYGHYTDSYGVNIFI